MPTSKKALFNLNYKKNIYANIKIIKSRKDLKITKVTFTPNLHPAHIGTK